MDMKQSSGSYKWLTISMIVIYLSGVNGEQNVTGPAVFLLDHMQEVASRVMYFSGSGQDMYDEAGKSDQLLDELVSDYLTSSEKTALSFDYDDSLLFWSDPGHHSIVKYDLMSGNQTTIFVGTSTLVVGIAVDWVANNVYWTDAAYNWIKIANYDGSFVRTLATTGLDTPGGITCDPKNGYLYWTDWGEYNKIERANLDGTNRIVLTNQSDIGSPAGVTLDHAQNILYWTDGEKNRIFSLDLNDEASVPQILAEVEEPLLELFSLDLDPDFGFIVSDLVGHHVLLVPFEGDSIFLQHLFEPNGIAFYNASRQPDQINTCANVECDHNCVSHPSGGKCVCNYGHTLRDDGKTCQPDNSIIHEHELVFSAKGNHLCKMPANIGHQDLPEVFNVSCFTQITVNAIDFDIYANFIYAHANAYQVNSILRVRLEDQQTWENIVDSTDARGIAVDWIASNLYWTDQRDRSIMISNLDGSESARLVYRELGDIYGIVVHPLKRLLFWSDTDSRNPRIERSSLNGRQRRVIVSANLMKPSNLAIDFNTDRLFWTDDYAHTIESVNFDGGERDQFMHFEPNAQFTGITVFQDFMFVGERTNRQIYIVNIPQKRRVRAITLAQEPTAVKFFHQSLQPINGEPNPCDFFNGGCDQICINTDHGAECLCERPSYSICTVVYRCPMTIPNGRMVDTCENTNGNRCRYTCDPGYVATRTTDVLCTDAGDWDVRGGEELCKEIYTCPMTIPNGRMVDTCENTNGNRCRYTCDPGYVATRTTDVLCTDAGDWDVRDGEELCKERDSIIDTTEDPMWKQTTKPHYPPSPDKRKGEGESSGNTTVVILAVCLALLVFFGVVVALGFFLLRRRKRNGQQQDTEQIVRNMAIPEQTPGGDMVGIPNPMYANVTGGEHTNNAFAPPQYSAVDPNVNSAAGGEGAMALPQKVALPPDTVELQLGNNAAHYLSTPPSSPFEDHTYDSLTVAQNTQAGLPNDGAAVNDTMKNEADA
ncbi:low-density lipoprotein receptor-related protein 6-like isoform X2 [Ptychodera flava]|uniref:low-density lipoprotein receptor-related protein 6-like isoform X2 n=1 Tax=Ptychodera flava TaxID=63121 RepID=UPI003969BD75